MSNQINSARVYITQVLDLLQNQSLRRDKVDWPKFRAEVLSSAATAVTEADTYPVIRAALRRLGDGHSALIAPSELAARVSRSPPWPKGILLDCAAYLEIPWFVQNDHVSPAGMAGKIQELIASLEASRPLGWIVDLRGNGGGNMWPMLTGLGPLLGGNPLGFFQPAVGPAIAWTYCQGVTAAGQDICVRMERQPYRLRASRPPIAVLFGPKTASSGEAVCIAFKGLPNARSFGACTAGQSTANEAYPLSDGALLALTTSVMVDRTGRPYGHAIEPDVLATGLPDAAAPDAALTAALDWVRSAARSGR